QGVHMGGTQLPVFHAGTVCNLIVRAGGLHRAHQITAVGRTTSDALVMQALLKLTQCRQTEAVHIGWHVAPVIYLHIQIKLCFAGQRDAIAARKYLCLQWRGKEQQRRQRGCKYADTCIQECISCLSVWWVRMIMEKAERIKGSLSRPEGDGR